MMWSLLKVFLFINLSSVVVVATRHCCPSESFLIEKSKTCSDNSSSYGLHCNHGALLLNPTVNEIDKFSLEPNGSLSFFDGQKRTPDEFCLGKILQNGTENSVALICFDDEWSQPKVSVVLRLLMLISTFFLVVTLYIYIALSNLKDLQGKCVIAFISCLIASYITLLVTQTFPNSSQEACVIQAASLYFFMSATFFWNNIITFNIWKAIRDPLLKINEKSSIIIRLPWGFGVPLCMVLLSFILEHIPDGNHIRPHFGETSCWFRGKSESWAFFYGPISILLLLNTVMFLQSTWTLQNTYRVPNTLKLKSLKFKYILYLKLFLLTGISWTFEIISYAMSEVNSTKYLWYITDCLNSAQGILIFLILVVFRQKVRLGLLKQKLLNINWPRSWANKEIQESSTESLKEDVEMAPQKTNLLI